MANTNNPSCNEPLLKLRTCHPTRLMQVAELLYQQAFSLSKLLEPDGDHKQLAQNLADALFGQGKVRRDVLGLCLLA